MCIHTHMLYRKEAFYACVCMHGFDNSYSVYVGGLLYSKVQINISYCKQPGANQDELLS